MLDLDFPPEEEGAIDGVVDAAPIAADNAVVEAVSVSTVEFTTRPWITAIGPR
jgi:hypothetical protein